jgi:hypothetical protein
MNKTTVTGNCRESWPKYGGGTGLGKLAAEIVPGSLKIWDGTRKKTTTTTNSDGNQVACEPADYHGNVTAPLFEQWFTDLYRVLQQWYGNCKIYMDGVASHKRVAESDKLPTTAWSKDRLVEWCGQHGYEGMEAHPKSTVLDLAQQLKQSATRQYVVYSICRQFGHTAKLTPPYHPELQPIERVWCAVKNPIANNPCGTMTELQAALRTNFRDLVNHTVLVSTYRQSKEWEDKYLKMAATGGFPSFQEGVLGADLESGDDSSSEEEEDETVPPTQQQDMETIATQDF